MTWTTREIDQLKKMWEEGASFLSLAARLGKTKGTVAGKIHRLQRAGELSGRRTRGLLPRAVGCRFPHGDPRDKANFRWCNKPIVAGPAPYCGEHMKVCYRNAET